MKGSADGLAGDNRGAGFVADEGLDVTFSGLLGGVLNGDIRSSDDTFSGCGAKELVSGWENMAGFAGILGFPARFAGGGSEALLSFLSSGLSCPFTVDKLGDSLCIVSVIGTEEPSFVGVIGRPAGEGETPADKDSLER